jgi:hypothetical protein
MFICHSFTHRARVARAKYLMGIKWLVTRAGTGWASGKDPKIVRAVGGRQFSSRSQTLDSDANFSVELRARCPVFWRFEGAASATVHVYRLHARLNQQSSAECLLDTLPVTCLFNHGSFHASISFCFFETLRVSADRRKCLRGN